MYELPRSKKYHENMVLSPCQENEKPCPICGKALQVPGENMIRLGEGGSFAISDQEAANDPSSDCGLYSVDAMCWNNYPDLHLYKHQSSPKSSSQLLNLYIRSGGEACSYEDVQNAAIREKFISFFKNPFKFIWNQIK